MIGTVTYAVPGQRYAEVSRPDEAEFRMLGVAPAGQGQGVGRALVQACIDRARQQGRRALVLSSEVRMASAHRLYERMGFVRDPARDWQPQPGDQPAGVRPAVDRPRSATERQATRPRRRSSTVRSCGLLAMASAASRVTTPSRISSIRCWSNVCMP